MQWMTWTELFTALLVAAIAWYGYVVLRYFPGVLRRGLVLKKPGSTRVRWRPEQTAKTSADTAGDNFAPPVAPADTHAQVHELMQEIRLVFDAAARDQLEKSLVLEALGLRFTKYRALAADIRAAITQHVVNEFSLRLSIAVTREDIDALW
jgi:hypothetical protein